MEGCIASEWRAKHLPPHLRASLLHGSSSNSRAISCFDRTAAGEIVSRCPDGRHPNATHAGHAQGYEGRDGKEVSVRSGGHHRLSPVFEGEFGFELLHALPFMYWLEACGLLARTTACAGMRPFYFFASAGHKQRRCGTRPTRSQWLASSLPPGTPDGWSWAGRHSLRYYAYPSHRWLPPPIHEHYRPLPLPRRHSGGNKGDSRGASRGLRAWRRRAWVQNKYYPEGHGTADNFWSLDELTLILDRLLSSGFQVVYNHPELSLLGAADTNDEGKGQRGFRLGDTELIQRRYTAELASGALLLLPQLVRGIWAPLSYNEAQLRVLAKARCFFAPQGGASYLTFYQPGMHVVNDKTGKERCLSAQLASNGTSGTYWHYFTRLAQGGSVIYNVNGNRSRLRFALESMVSTAVCEVDVASAVL